MEKVTVEVENLKKVLKGFSGLKEKTNSIYFNVGSSDLEISRSSNTCLMNAKIAVETCNSKPYAFGLNFSFLQGILSTVKTKEICFENKEGQISLKDKDDTNISMLKIMGTPTKFLFPEDAVKFSWNFTADDYINIMNVVKIAVAKDEMRPIFNGVHLVVKNENICFYATDTHVLSKYCIASEAECADFSAILPAEIFNIIPDEDVNLKISDRMIKVEYGNTKIIAGRIEGQSPDFESVFPNQENTTSVYFNKVALKNALEKVNICAAGIEPICISFEESKLQMNCENKELGSASLSIPVSYSAPLNDKIYFNPKFLLEAIQQMDEVNGVLIFTAPLKPVMIKNHTSDKWAFVATPIRGKN